MDSRSHLVDLSLTVFAAVSSAALFYFGTGLNPIWPLPWLAPIPILLLASRASTRKAASAAFLAYFVGGLNVWHFFHAILQLPLLPVIAFTVIPAVLFAIVVLAWRRLLLRGRLWAATFSFPLLWSAIEYANAATSPHSTYGSIAYTQMDFLPLIQLASVMGIWGISFVLFLLPSVIGVLASPKGSTREKTSLALVVAVMFLAVLGFGAWRLRTPLQATGTVRVRMLSSSAPSDIFPHEQAKAVDLANRYAAQLLPDGGTAKPDVVIIPEKIVHVDAPASAAVRGVYSAAATKEHVETLVGLDEISDGQRRNDALLFGTDGRIEANYEKHHFIPVLEDGYALGTEYQVLQRPSGLWGIAICKDMDFPPLSREYGKRGIGLLLVPAWDFRYDDWLHQRMAILRGVESGFTIARNAKQGRLSITDNRGRVLAEALESRTGFAVVDATAPVAHADTIYTRFGDWFAWLCVAESILIIALLFVKARQA
ncbi:MAG TPA: nitrilase-related carbon-nitrogen hydrolase [Candidatus Acidoferrum sp.]|nr:nitrilase-related carbon-nitrogen hydrolase [Candidatus Acidoferrum sp.]